MRLIHTTTLEFEIFTPPHVPEYAILSHCWDDGEVSLQQFEAGARNAKILACCRLAREQGLQWAWIDTCCIDKTSSAELSEAINSMYTWYERSAVCYAFVTGVKSVTPHFVDCRWFTRGWTLQELLAPSKVEFYAEDNEFEFIGTRHDLVHEISAVTGIHFVYLRKRCAVVMASVAERMSWMAKRQTTRVEDVAYSLLGLFDVNMPLLYGEGEKAFQRLQHHIIAQSDDETIFAWVSKQPLPDHGILAPSPCEFESSWDMFPTSDHRPPYRITQNSLEINPAPQSVAALMTRVTQRMGRPLLRKVTLSLRCKSAQDIGFGPGPPIIQLISDARNGRFYRADTTTLYLSSRLPWLHKPLLPSALTTFSNDNIYIGITPMPPPNPNYDDKLAVSNEQPHRFIRQFTDTISVSISFFVCGFVLLRMICSVLGIQNLAGAGSVEDRAADVQASMMLWFHAMGKGWQVWGVYLATKGMSGTVGGHVLAIMLGLEWGLAALKVGRRL